MIDNKCSGFVLTRQSQSEAAKEVLEQKPGSCRVYENMLPKDHPFRNDCTEQETPKINKTRCKTKPKVCKQWDCKENKVFEEKGRDLMPIIRGVSAKIIDAAGLSGHAR